MKKKLLEIEKGKKKTSPQKDVLKDAVRGFFGKPR
jgi:hypothetical protein